MNDTLLSHATSHELMTALLASLERNGYPFPDTFTAGDAADLIATGLELLQPDSQAAEEAAEALQRGFEVIASVLPRSTYDDTTAEDEYAAEAYDLSPHSDTIDACSKRDPYDAYHMGFKDCREAVEEALSEQARGEECVHEFVPFQPNCVRCGIPYEATP